MTLRRTVIPIVALALLQGPAPAAPAVADRPATVNVMGYVERPGMYELQGEMTVLTAVAKAGGIARAAEKELMVIVSRKISDKLTQEIRYNSLAELKEHPEADTDLQPNDKVMIVKPEAVSEKK